MSFHDSENDIVVGVDGSPASDAAVRWAADEARLCGSSVTLVHVMPPAVATWPVGAAYGSLTDWQEANAKDVIDRARHVIATIGVGAPPDVHTEMVTDNIVSALVAASKNARMLVVGNDGYGAVSRLLLGSTSSAVLHHALCPVAVVRAEEGRTLDPHAPVVVGIDGSPASESATAAAFDEADRRGVDLVAVHAWSDLTVFPAVELDWREYQQKAEELLGQRLAGWAERYPNVRVQRCIQRDDPAKRLIEESRRAQLLVVGSHGRGGFTGMLLGSVSAKVARTADIPVIVMRPR
ncbi:universal stress protein [Mycobacterium sp. NPDC050551]|uniref:universal stress protein n=1 Tax=Mycobacterium sp. NPDC050551 TaxID=3155407 RepID=UPI0034152E30